jgi:glutaredoxin
MQVPPEVTLYTRPGCHLCEIARRDLVRLREQEPGFDLREVDIGCDDSLHTLYLERIPVIEVNGEIVAELTLDVDALRRRLHTVAG